MNSASQISDPGDKGLWKRFLTYFVPHRGTILVVLVTMIFVGLADATLALAGKVMMDLFTGISQTADGIVTAHLAQSFWGHRLFDRTFTGLEAIRSLLWNLALATLILVIVKGLVHFAKEYLIWQMTHRILMTLKSELFARIVRFPMPFFDREKSGETLSRITYDATQMEGSIHSGFILVKSLIYVLIFVTAMFLMDWSLTLLVIAVFPLSGLLIKLFGDRIRRASRKVSLNVADYTAFLGEALGGAKVIKAFGRERDQERMFQGKIQDNYRYSMKIAKYATLHSPSQEIFASIGMAAVILFCGYRLLAGRMTVGDLTGFVILLNYAYQPIKTLGETNLIFQRAMASGRRIFNLIDQPVEQIVIGSGTLKPQPVKGELNFVDVRFAYQPETPVLAGISLKVSAGETLALVGPSGGGKTTLMNLIPRFYPLTQGRIELDGVNTREWELDFLRAQMAIVPQETLLFSGSIEENIRFGKPGATIEEVIVAAEAANIHHFIEQLHAGYRAEVGERGVTLSGGQRQRIALARAILRNPKILLLDEATSSLDSESERLIQEALDRFRKDRTTIIIAHRLSTVQSADRIAVLEAGKLVELGTHRQLYEAGGLYRRLCDQQLRG